MSARVAAALALLLAASGCSLVKVSKLPDPHDHYLAVHEVPPIKDRMHDMERRDPHQLELIRPRDMERIENPGRTKDATVVLMKPPRFGARIPVLLVYRNDKPTLAYTSKTMALRPMGNLVWINDQVLAFDTFAGRDYGWHYLLDASIGKMIHAAPFDDREAEPEPEPAPAPKPAPAAPQNR